MEYIGRLTLKLLEVDKLNGAGIFALMNIVCFGVLLGKLLIAIFIEMGLAILDQLPLLTNIVLLDTNTPLRH